MNRDITEVFYAFASNCKKALDAQNVQPEKDYVCAVMCVIHHKDVGYPIAGSLNYKDGKWEVEIQLELPTPIEVVNEADIASGRSAGGTDS